MNATQDSLRSSYRGILLQHLFIGSVMRHLWLRGIAQFEVLKPEVDDSGYDLVLEANGVVRHVQLKASAQGAKTDRVDISLKLLSKPSACVIWMHFDKATMELGPFYWFGSSPGKPLAEISGFRVTKHTRANVKGKKGQRPAYRVVRKSKFDRLEDVEQVVTRLFGSFPTVSEGP